MFTHVIRSVRLAVHSALTLMQAMNSPEAGSPTYSTPSSESPPPEEVNYPPQNTSQLAQLANHVAASLSNSGNVGSPIGSASGNTPATIAVSSGKRRQPHNVSVRDRDVKTRRREPRAGGSIGTWESLGGKEGGRKDKEEFIDAHIVEKLRKDIGDPFLELES